MIAYQFVSCIDVDSGTADILTSGKVAISLQVKSWQLLGAMLRIEHSH